MIEITDYKQTNYKDFQKELKSAFEKSGKTAILVAANIKVKSQVTIKNAFNCDMQVVSDEVLTNVMKSVGFPGFVLWVLGKRHYYTKVK